jgi:hypothetical protein
LLDAVASNMPSSCEPELTITLATWAGVSPGFADRMPAAIPTTSEKITIGKAWGEAVWMRIRY